MDILYILLALLIVGAVVWARSAWRRKFPAQVPPQDGDPDQQVKRPIWRPGDGK